MIFELRKESREFLALVGKALRRALNTDEQQRFDRLLKDHSGLRKGFHELEKEVEKSKLDELWERGLRVLLRVPRSGDKAFLESVKSSDPRAWQGFLKGAFILRVMAKSMNRPLPTSISKELTKDQEKQLFAAVRVAQDKRKQDKLGSRSK